MNDLRPIALTSIVMKCFERIILKPEMLVDSCQYAYLSKKGVEDATLTLIDNVTNHLDKMRSYVRMMFIDFSSAFNTIQPHIMLRKLTDKNVNSNLILWINSFLTCRDKYVKFQFSDLL